MTPICEPTLQGVFNYVTAHLFEQGRVAMDGSTCQYLSSTGARCAVGCLIPSELYDAGLEGVTIDYKGDNETQLMRRGKLRAAVALALGVAELDERMLRLLGKLQAVHDHGAIQNDLIEYWTEQLAHIATQFGLTFTPPTPSTPAPCSTPTTSSTP